MNCLNFPDIFTRSSTNILYDKYATERCLYLLLNCESGEMFGDPDFGVKLKKYFFNQNDYILKDILIDEIYTKIDIFCPQITISRKNIKIETINKNVYCKITYMNNDDFTTTTYDIVLFKGE